ncbi:hypothetical protein [Mesorhizobium sp.]|uniref:hypothetical protein n=1 Tax=Mesorhizobium sp. TaxID=1871066 RepID=UPI0025C7183F|nr:hypothetical protein [Mesorhizobium sp.]
MDRETFHSFQAGASTRSVPKKLDDKTGIFDITHHNKIGGQPLLPLNGPIKSCANYKKGSDLHVAQRVESPDGQAQLSRTRQPAVDGGKCGH